MNRQQLFSKLEESLVILGKIMHEKVATDFNISPAQQHVLMVLGEGGPTTIKSLSEKLGVTSGATTQHIDALEKLGFVSRNIDESNRRQVVVSITPTGWQQFKDMSSNKFKVLTTVFDVLDDKELEDLVSLVDKVSKHHKKGNKE